MIALSTAQNCRVLVVLTCRTIRRGPTHKFTAWILRHPSCGVRDSPYMNSVSVIG